MLPCFIIQRTNTAKVIINCARLHSPLHISNPVNFTPHYDYPILKVFFKTFQGFRFYILGINTLRTIESYKSING